MSMDGSMDINTGTGLSMEQQEAVYYAWKDQRDFYDDHTLDAGNESGDGSVYGVDAVDLEEHWCPRRGYGGLRRRQARHW